MELHLFLTLWFVSVIFTLSSFHFSSPIFSIVSAIHWASLSLLVPKINFIGFGDTNVITYTYMGTTGETGLIYLFSMMSLVMFFYAAYLIFEMTKKTVVQ